jgi:segregation and condensation protein B
MIESSIAADDAALGRASLPDLDLPALCEALLFIAAAPTAAVDLAKAIGVEVEAVVDALDHLDATLRESGSGLRVLRHGDRYALTSAPSAARIVARFLGLNRTERLSAAALETLAIIAYRGPATRGEIEAIRGVDSSGVVQTLLARELVEAVGRRNTVGAPFEYVVTPTFLRHFGLASLNELPPLGEVQGRAVEEAWDERLAGVKEEDGVESEEGRGEKGDG